MFFIEIRLFEGSSRLHVLISISRKLYLLPHSSFEPQLRDITICVEILR